jgi:hypothetical protein
MVATLFSRRSTPSSCHEFKKAYVVLEDDLELSEFSHLNT